jgi:predicted DNA-binding transcriptional regulator AlpA
MDDECEVVFMADLAKMLGRTESAVRQGLSRGVDWLPKSFRMGSRHCWLKEDIREFLRACRDGENKAPKIGRPRQTPPTLRDIRR